MSHKKKIIISSDALWLRSGLAENAKYLMRHLVKTGKYDLVYYAQQVSVGDPNHRQMFVKSIGCLPDNPTEIQHIMADEGRKRWAAYGGYMMDRVIEEEKPDIFVGVNDIWSYPDPHKKSWFNKLNFVYHITVDSKPILPLAYEQARACKNYFTWAKFAQKEMIKQGIEYSHVKQIYGMSNIDIYSPITKNEKSDLRKKFGINEKTVLIGYVFRNQLRKSVPELLIAFKEYKKENPFIDVKLHLHTHVPEMAGGWDIPRLMDYHKINKNDVLFTYYCKNCKQWEVKPYEGEDRKCRYCHAEKDVITPNIGDGVADDEMRYIYGLWDASVSPITSGGMEYHNVQSLLCGKYLASTNYSSGEDFAEQPFVYSISWHPRGEHGTSFIKSSNDINSIKGFISKVCKMSQRDFDDIGEKSRDWALKTFSADVIGKQWENVFDNLPDVDTSKITIEVESKNDQYAMPNITDDLSWVKDLYKNILKMDVPDHDSGVVFWISSIKNGRSRQDIYNYFISVARDENNKNQKPVDFGTFLDKNGKKRALFVIKQSIGDVLICTQLFESLHEQYPNTDLYVATDMKYASVLLGNPYVHKILPYQDFMESEMACIGAGQPVGNELFNYYFHPAIQTQRQLNYLSADSIAQKLQ